MKILWHSVAPWCPTGYGQQTATFVPRLRAAGHEITISARYGLEGGRITWKGDINVLPRDDGIGDAIIAIYAKALKDCQVITLFDVWPFLEAVDVLRDVPRLACWVPVDHDPVPPRVAEFFQESRARPIAMSRFGEKALRDAGFDPLYVPHGIDTDTFKPVDRDEARRFFGIQEGRFVVGMVANNNGNAPPRKAFPQALAAFAEFRENHEDAMLWLHCELTGRVNPGQPGVHIPTICERMQIPADSVAYTPALQGIAANGVPPSQLAMLYSAFDVLLNPSYGEGFGIPVVEAQACGTPVIVSEWTSMPELCGAGWRVDGEPWYDANQHSLYLAPSVPAIAAALEEAYEKGSGMREKAREFAVRYDADRVMEEHWLPVLGELGRPREVPPLPNRAMRRAAAKTKAAA